MSPAVEPCVRLVPFDRSHVDSTYTWVCQPELRNAFLIRGEVTLAGHHAYFQRVLRDPSQRAYAILGDNKHIGNCGLKHLDLAAREAEFWIYIGDPSTRRKGAGKAAIRMLIKEARRIGIRRFVVHVAETNVAALRMYRNAGFVETGEAQGEWRHRDVRVVRMVCEPQ